MQLCDHVLDIFSIHRPFSVIDSFTGSDDATVRLWDLHKRQAIATLKGHLKTVTAVAFESSGKYIASGRNSPEFL